MTLQRRHRPHRSRMDRQTGPQVSLGLLVESSTLIVGEKLIAVHWGVVCFVIFVNIASVDNCYLGFRVYF